MTTELINELRSAAATLRKPFPAGFTPASDLAAAELLERAAQEIARLHALAPDPAAAEKLDQLLGLQEAHDQRNGATADQCPAGEATHILGVLDTITENLFDRVRRGVLTPAQATAKVHRHTAALRAALAPAKLKALHTLAVLASVTPNLFDYVHHGTLLPAQAAAAVLRHIAELQREIMPLYVSDLAAKREGGR